jgi:hypothetical protein
MWQTITFILALLGLAVEIIDLIKAIKEKKASQRSIK